MKCYVGFSYSDNLISRLIANKMGKEYSHVFMLFPWNNQMIVLHATSHGVSALQWEQFQKNNKIVKMIEIQDEIKGQKAFDYCVSRLGQKYGFLAIIAIGLGIHYQDGEKTLICSEYVTRALELDFNKIEDLITPKDIEDKL